MIIIANEQVYIMLDKKFAVDTNTHVFIKDIGEVYCQNKVLKKNIEELRILNGKEEEDWEFITSIDVTNKIIEYYQNVDVNMIGADEVLLEIKSQEKEKPFLEFLKIAFVCIILFFGACLAIINFHEDVNMKVSLEKLYYTFTGKKDKNPLIMVIPYSIGIGVGMLTFFNRIFSFSRRRRKEPGPMEIELYLYDKDMEEHIMNELKKDENS
ncbi:stage V sporulation protein AA [Tissierella simiarum]|uniref:stage V sporulation protein AA n=1 Tax=Tissierella simiarum TaxID=2841534 RepID=UPI0031BAFE51